LSRDPLAARTADRIADRTVAPLAPTGGEDAETAAGPARRRLRGGALWFGAVSGFGLLLFLYHYLESVAVGQPETPLAPFIRELTGAFVGGLLFFPIRWLVRRLPLASARWPRRLPVYLLAVLVCGGAATTLMWGLRSILFPLAGLGAYDYGVMPLRYLMELPLQVVWIGIVVAGLHAYAALDAARRRELRAARLESSLARSQLRNLRLQLQPHFLFNALHTVSAAMYDDPAAADEMLDQLAELLRASLRTAQSDEVPLGEELALLDRYLAIQRARFGDRLDVSIQIEPGAGFLLVPSLLLQPLVENAIRHGNAERAGRGAIAVRARQEDGRLLLEVEDDGPGGGAAPGISSAVSSSSSSSSFPPAFAPPAADGGASPGSAGSEPAATAAVPRGLGLSATAERLQLLYGDAQTFSAGHAPAGGFLVRASLPLRRAAGAGAGAGAGGAGASATETAGAAAAGKPASATAAAPRP
jgi:two-component system LytT family sensor kinase